MGERAMRPFWIHQLVEYLIGVALVTQGLQDPEPLVPAIAGMLVIGSAAITRGPLGAFRTIGRGVHRWLDVAVMVAIVGLAVQPWLEVSSSGRVLVLVVLVPIAFLWFYTDWAERPARSQRRAARSGNGGEQMGRTMGRLSGKAYSAARDAVKNRSAE